MMNTLLALAVVSGILSLFFLGATIVTLRKKSFLNSLLGLLVALLTFTLALLFGTIVITQAGYRALTHEEVAAVIRVEPQPQKRFIAHFEFQDGIQTSFQLAGDELYVDAHILKWKPFVNILGLHTAYELDRIGGRYLDIEKEQTGPRTIFLISKPKPIDWLGFRYRSLAMGWLLDAEYGSAAFIESNKPATYEIRISTTGLLIREAEKK